MVIEQTYNETENVLSFKIQGELDVSNISEFKEKLFRGIESHSPNVLMDCADLKYIDSTGLGVLVSALKKTKASGGYIKIVRLKPYLQKIFVITALDKIFDIEVDGK
jgi:anti-sigma B factor antagonist